jgi:uncharacterized protein (DUF111 family)
MKKDKHLYIDCTRGISGDMILAALVDLGVNPGNIINGLAGFGWTVSPENFRREERDGVSGLNIYFDSPSPAHSHGEGHHHDHGEDHSHRSFREIEGMIRKSSLTGAIKDTAIAIYETIGEAEAKVHGTDLDHVHFHEVGRDTAIMNVIGVAICLEFLQIGRITCSDLHDGTGFIHCSHGRIPVPVPAVQAMLEGTAYRLVQEEIETEMVTPSGLGILKGIQALPVSAMPGKVLASGTGFGKKDTGRPQGVTAYLLDKSVK